MFQGKTRQALVMVMLEECWMEIPWKTSQILGIP